MPQYGDKVHPTMYIGGSGGEGGMYLDEWAVSLYRGGGDDKRGG